MRKNEKGITLVALVVTIIVLLILAGVTIAFVVGQNGVFQRGTHSPKDAEMAVLRDYMCLAQADAKTEYLVHRALISVTNPPQDTQAPRTAETIISDNFPAGFCEKITDSYTAAEGFASRS